MYRLVYRIFQGFAGAEFRNFLGLDGDLLASLRISALSGGSLGDFPCAEAHDADPVSFFQRLGNDLCHRLNRKRRVLLGKFGLLRDFLYQFHFVHDFTCLSTVSIVRSIIFTEEGACQVNTGHFFVLPFYTAKNRQIRCLKSVDYQ